MYSSHDPDIIVGDDVASCWNSTWIRPCGRSEAADTDGRAFLYEALSGTAPVPSSAMAAGTSEEWTLAASAASSSESRPSFLSNVAPARSTGGDLKALPRKLCADILDDTNLGIKSLPWWMLPSSLALASGAEGGVASTVSASLPPAMKHLVLPNIESYKASDTVASSLHAANMSTDPRDLLKALSLKPYNVSNLREVVEEYKLQHGK